MSRELLQRALTALEENRQSISEWGGYASDYFKEKYKLDADICSNDALIAEIKMELARPDPEPVAYVTGSTVRWLHAADKLKDRQPLYADQPSRKPLSYDEIIKILRMTGSPTLAIKIARAIEKAHGIGATSND